MIRSEGSGITVRSWAPIVVAALAAACGSAGDPVSLDRPSTTASSNVEEGTTTTISTAGPPLDEPFDLTIDLVHGPSDGSATLGIVVDGTDVPDDLYLCHYWPDATIAGAVRITGPGERVLLPIEEFDPKVFCLFRSATERTLKEMNAFGGGPADDLDAWIITSPATDDVLQVALDDEGVVLDDGVVYDGAAGARPWR